jgi:hypothetical protein
MTVQDPAFLLHLAQINRRLVELNIALGLRSSLQLGHFRVAHILAQHAGAARFLRIARVLNLSIALEAFLVLGDDAFVRDVVEQFLQDQRPHAVRNLAISSLRRGDVPLLIRLLVDVFGLNPIQVRHSVLRLAIDLQRLGTVLAIVRPERPDIRQTIQRAIQRQNLLAAAGATGNMEMLEMLLAFDPRQRGHSQALLAATAANRGNISRALLQIGIAQASEDRNRPLRNVARHGDVALAEQLLEIAQVTPGSMRSEAVRLAAINNQPAMVELLARDPRTNVHARNDQALISASRSGYLDVVLALMQSERFAPTAAVINEAIVLARDHPQLRQLLEQYVRDPQGTLAAVRMNRG